MQAMASSPADGAEAAGPPPLDADDLGGRPGDASTPWVPRALALGAYLVLAVLALAYPDKLREPDPYAYRASIEALEQGDLTLTPEQYAALDARLRADGDGWERTGPAAGATVTPPGGATCGAAGPGATNGPAGPGGLPPGGSGADGARPFVPPTGIPGGVDGPVAGGGIARGPVPVVPVGPGTTGGVGAAGAAGSAMGIAQWVGTPSGQCASEKNPGYPFLMVAFDAVGVLRLGPLVYGALGCLGLWFGARRWLGPWGGAFSVALFCSPSAVLIMANRATMPSFTDAALLAAGGGALVWVVLATEVRWRRRVVVGAAAALALGAAVTVRYTNAVPVAVLAVWAVVAALRPRWGLGWRSLVPWAAAGAVPLVLAAAYDDRVFGGPLAVGYEQAGGLPQLTLANVTENLRVMPARLVQALPVFVLAAAALVLALVVAAYRRVGRRSPSPGSTVDGWVLPVLAGWWLSLWGLYAAFGWTWQSVPVGAHPIVATRFYLPATGALALLAAWLFVRVPRWAAVAAVVVLFVVGGLAYRDAVTSGPMFQAVGTGGPTSGPGGGPGPSFPGGVGGAPGPSLPGRVGGAPGSAPSPGVTPAPGITPVPGSSASGGSR